MPCQKPLNNNNRNSIFSICPAIGIVVIVLSVSSCVPQLGDSDAALLLEDILAGEESSRLKTKTSTPAQRSIEYTVDDRHNKADLYLSPQGSLAGIVLIPGVTKKGKNDPRLIGLANTLARLRFAVLVPEVAGLRKFHIRASDVRTMADALYYLANQEQFPLNGKIGFGGFSYGVGVVLLASLESDIRDKVDFILGFGGYHDIASIVTFFTTGYYRDDQTGKLVYRNPHYYLKQVFTISNSALLQSTADRDRLRSLVENDIDDIDQELAELSPDARALYELITNEDPKRVTSLIEKLSAPIKTELQGINPAKSDLSQIKAQVILLHGRGDNMIPYTESIAIAKALPKEKTRLFIIEGYAHTNVKPKREDLPQILSAMELLMQQRTSNEILN